jgi:hypothetical protein
MPGYQCVDMGTVRGLPDDQQFVGGGVGGGVGGWGRQGSTKTMSSTCCPPANSFDERGWGGGHCKGRGASEQAWVSLSSGMACFYFIFIFIIWFSPNVFFGVHLLKENSICTVFSPLVLNVRQ